MLSTPEKVILAIVPMAWTSWQGIGLVLTSSSSTTTRRDSSPKEFLKRNGQTGHTVSEHGSFGRSRSEQHAFSG